jgi:putative FmdB family regulatory protein
MALYEYKCLQCGTINEVYHSINDDARVKTYCKSCSNNESDVKNCKRLIGNSGGFRLSDSEGWAKTGYDKNVDMVSQFFD